MTILTIPTEIICESDPIANGICIECFGTKKRLYFYNSQGPFCDLQCFCNFEGLDMETIPKVRHLKKYVK